MKPGYYRIETPPEIKSKSRDELEQEFLKLQDLLYQEKLKRAESLLEHRLGFSGIIFLLLFFILIAKSEDASWGMQWFFFILFIAAALVVLGIIFNSYSKAQSDARKIPSSQD